MASKLGEVFIDVVTKDSTAKGYEDARHKANQFLRDITTGLAQGVGQAIAQGVGNLVRAAVDKIGESVEAAGNLNRELRRVNVVFGESADDIRAWASTAERSLGLTETAALKAASGLGSMFVQFGATNGEAAALSKQMVEAARDIAAFNGVAGGAETVLEAFAASFRGEYDSLQRYIPAISDAAIKQLALAESGKESAEQLTQNEKLLATQTLILRGAAIATGAYAASLDTAAGQEERFTRRIEDGLARIGRVFEPIRRVFFEELNLLVDLIAPYGEGILDSFAAGLAKGLVALTPFFAQLRAAFVYWLQPSSPPRLLSDIDEWGTTTAEEYIKGFAEADLSGLRSLGGLIESVLRSFAGTGEVAEGDLIGRIFGTRRSMEQAIRDFREVGNVSLNTLDDIADAAGPAGKQIAILTRQYFELQRATVQLQLAQDELNEVTNRYDEALAPVNKELDDIRDRQRDIRRDQELEDLGTTLKDPRAEASDRELARLRIEELRLEEHAETLEEERDLAVDAAQRKIDAAQAETQAQQERFNIAQVALEQQQQTNALIEEEIALRQRLINEALQEEKRARAELEQLQREIEQEEKRRLAELERIADAQLRYRLATTDTEGQLELLRAELDKVAEGSAEYYDILTQIAGLEKRLADERAENDEGILGALLGGDDGGSVTEATGGVKALEEAMRGFFAAIKGEGEPVKLNPFFKNIVDGISDIGDIASDVGLMVKDFIALFTGESTDATSTADILRPTYSSGMIGQIYSYIKSGIEILRALRDGDWTKLWETFMGIITTVLTAFFGDPEQWPIVTWLGETLIPAVNLIADNEWKAAWEKLGGNAIKGMSDGMLAEMKTSPSFQALTKFFELLKAGDIVGAWAVLSQTDPSLPPSENNFKNGTEWYKFFGIPTIPKIGPPKGQDLMPPSDFSSLPGGLPGLAPLVPAMAGGGMINSNNVTYVINQEIGLNGDVGGAFAGAESGIRQAVTDQRLKNG